MDTNVKQALTLLFAKVIKRATRLKDALVRKKSRKVNCAKNYKVLFSRLL